MFIVSKPRILAIPLLFTWAAGTAWADRIELKDGDRITGAIVKKDGQTVTLQSKNFGLVTLKWENIATVRTEKPLNVVLPGDKSVRANLETRDGRIEVYAPGVAQTVPPEEVVALRNDAEQAAYERSLHPGLLGLWTITGSLNRAGAKGNAATSTITTPVDLVRASSTSSTKAYFNSIRSKATVAGVSAQTARAVRGGWGHSRNLTKKILMNAFNDYEYDNFQALDLRVVLGGGWGYNIWTGEAGRLALVAGGAWNRETFDPDVSPVFTRNSVEVYWGDDFTYKLAARTELVQAFRMFNNLSNKGEYRVNFDISANTRVNNWLTWRITLSDRYLSNPLANRLHNDLLYTMGLAFSFSR
jgi:putative salt-induced outer membrane protein YdiY